MNERAVGAKLLGRYIIIGSRKELLYEAKKRIGKGGIVATVNPLMLVAAVNNPALARVLDRSLCIPDGVGIRRALKKRGIDTEVYPGVELVPDLLFPGASIGILGAKEGVAEAAFAHLERGCPGIKLSFACDGYNYSMSEVKRELSEKKPHIMLVALGSPRQELLMDNLKSCSKSTLFIGVGGSLDVYSGLKKRAPKLARDAGLEWLYRMLNEPSRLKGLCGIADFFTLAAIERRKIL